MYDKRVVRGNTWALRKMAQEALQVELAEERRKQKERRQNLRKELEGKLSRSPRPKRNQKVRNDSKHRGVDIDEVLAKSESGKTIDSGSLNSGVSFNGSQAKRPDRDADVQTDSHLTDNASIISNLSPRFDVETQVDEKELLSTDSGLDVNSERLSSLAMTIAAQEVHDDMEMESIKRKEEELQQKKDFELQRLHQLEAERLEASAEVEKLESLKNMEVAKLHELEETVRSARQEKEKLTAEESAIEDETKKLTYRNLAWKSVQEMIPMVTNKLAVGGFFEVQDSIHDFLQSDIVADETLSDDIDKDRLTGIPEEHEPVSPIETPESSLQKSRADTQLTEDLNVDGMQTIAETEAIVSPNEASYREELRQTSHELVRSLTASSIEKIAELPIQGSRKVNRDIAEDFLPWLTARVVQEMEYEMLSRFLADNVLSEVQKELMPDE